MYATAGVPQSPGIEELEVAHLEIDFALSLDPLGSSKMTGARQLLLFYNEKFIVTASRIIVPTNVQATKFKVRKVAGFCLISLS